MVKAIEIRPLARDDDRSGFSCGQPDLDRFFEHYAGQNQFKLHLAVTYVAAVEARIVGFATVAGSSVERASVPSARLRKRLPAYPLPVLRLARLGVDTRAQGLGIGKALLRHVLALAVGQRDRIGCVGVVTDAKREAVSFYQGLGFVSVDGVREGLLHGEPLPMFLAIDTIASASKAEQARGPGRLALLPRRRRRRLRPGPVTSSRGRRRLVDEDDPGPASPGRVRRQHR